jgi:hypothetical protein
MTRETFGACVSFRACWALEAVRSGVWHGKRSMTDFRIRRFISSRFKRLHGAKWQGIGKGRIEVDMKWTRYLERGWCLGGWQTSERYPIKTRWQSSCLSSILRSSIPQPDEKKSRVSKLLLLGHRGPTNVQDCIRWREPPFSDRMSEVLFDPQLPLEHHNLI